MLVTLWQDNEKYQNTYWEKFQNLNYYYYTGDYAVSDDDGYFWLLGRADDILKVSGHRFGTAELESAFLANKEVAEVAVTSRQDQEKGDVVVAFLVLRTGFSASDQLRIEIIDNIRRTIGSIASHDQIYFVSRLPKTRTGKVLRRVLKSIVNDEEEEIGDISTIQDDGSIEEIKQAHSCLKK
jgi:acetyl-CoA synthetase